jgi:plastocyanin
MLTVFKKLDYLVSIKYTAMKKGLLFFIVLWIASATNATIYNVTISGLAYTPASLTTACVGDTVRISASGNHPCTQVSLATWTANGATPIAGALFTSQTTQVQIILTASSPSTIYYVCDNHVASAGMKGQIVVCAAAVFETLLSDFKFGVLPNPVKDQANIYINAKKADNISLSIVDLNGRLVKTIANNKRILTGEQLIQFSVSEMSAGNYFMILRTSTGGMTRKQFIVLK